MKYKYLISKIALISAIFILIGMQACIDKDYEWDDMNKNLELKIPPLPIGSLDSILVNSLVNIENTTSNRVVLCDTISNIFGEDVIEKFFYDGAKGIELVGFIDVGIKHAESHPLTVDVSYNVLNNDNTLNRNVSIASQMFVNGKDQKLSIPISKEAIPYMQESRHLLLTITIRSAGVTLAAKDFLLLHDLVLRSGGIQIEIK